MNNQEIQSFWSSRRQRIIVYSAGILDMLNLQEHTAKFLHTVGLPAEAAPFLSFNENTSGEWNSLSRLTDRDSGFDYPFAALVQMGSDGNGNPIVIDTADNDSIKLLDHDNSFSLHIINSSVESIASSLVAYATFIDEIIAQKDNADFDTHFTDEQFETLKTTLLSADTNFDKSEFWHGELSMLLDNRAHYRSSSGD